MMTGVPKVAHLHTAGQDEPALTRRAETAAAVLRTIAENEPVSRREIATQTGLSHASVTEYTSALAARGLVEESASPRGGRVGRPTTPLGLDSHSRFVGAIHIGVPFSVVSLLDLRGSVLYSERVQHRAMSPEVILADAAAVLTRCIANHPWGAVVSVGVASAGWVDPAAGTVIDHPMLGWANVPVCEMLRVLLGLPVALDAHPRSLVVAERLFGAHRSQLSIANIVVGNVVDLAFVTGDTLHYGPRSYGSAVAHLPLSDESLPCRCGRIGCLEASVTESRLTLHAVELGLIAEPRIALLVDAALAGNEVAHNMFLHRARNTGRAVALLADVLNPDVFVVTESGIGSLPGCLAELRRSVAESSRTPTPTRPHIAPTSFPRRVAEVASGAVALAAIYNDPLNVAPIPDTQRQTL